MARNTPEERSQLFTELKKGGTRDFLSSLDFSPSEYSLLAEVTMKFHPQTPLLLLALAGARSTHVDKYPQMAGILARLSPEEQEAAKRDCVAWESALYTLADALTVDKTSRQSQVQAVGRVGKIGMFLKSFAYDRNNRQDKYTTLMTVSDLRNKKAADAFSDPWYIDRNGISRGSLASLLLIFPETRVHAANRGQRRLDKSMLHDEHIVPYQIHLDNLADIEEIREARDESPYALSVQALDELEAVHTKRAAIIERWAQRAVQPNSFQAVRIRNKKRI